MIMQALKTYTRKNQFLIWKMFQCIRSSFNLKLDLMGENTFQLDFRTILYQKITTLLKFKTDWTRSKAKTNISTRLIPKRNYSQLAKALE